MNADLSVYIVYREIFLDISPPINMYHPEPMGGSEFPDFMKKSDAIQVNMCRPFPRIQKNTSYTIIAVCSSLVKANAYLTIGCNLKVVGPYDIE